MRFAILGVFVFGLPSLAFAQDPCAPHRLPFDPYKPSDLAVIRQSGGSVLAHAPLTSLLELDQYVPSEAQLLRESGGALPLWPFVWYPAYPPYPVYPAYPPPPYLRDCCRVRKCTPPPVATAERPITTVAELMTALQRARPSSVTTPPAGGPSVSAPAPSVDPRMGVSIDYAGRTWVSAGRAVPLDDAQFERVGEKAGSPVFKRRGANDDIIYVQTTNRVVAPFRATAK